MADGSLKTLEPSDSAHCSTETAANLEPDMTKPKPDQIIDVDTANDKKQPLKETDVTSPKPPISGSEKSGIPNTSEVQPSVDNGFFPHANHPNSNDRRETDDEDHRLIPSCGSVTPVPNGSEFGPEAETTAITPDVNVYQQKKTLAQGMMDLALLSANANQLRYILEAGYDHPYFYSSLTLIISSLILQVGVGIGLILNGKYDVKKDEHMHKANNVNNYTVIGIFMVTVLNVVLSAFVVTK